MGSSSAKASHDPHSSSTLTRKGFALTGPSVLLDPATHAVRGDLADVRLADRVFAPHYAEPMTCIVLREATLRGRANGETLATLQKGDRFELLELVGATAWGIAPAAGRVGYCDRAALELA